VPKFPFNARRHRRSRSVVCKKNEILEVYDLREDRQLLAKVLGEFRRSSIRWNKPESSPIDRITSLLDIQASNFPQSHDDGPDCYPKRYQRSELPVSPAGGFLEQLCKLFQSLLDVSRLERNHGERVSYPFAKVHPERMSGVYEERVEDRPGSITVQQSLLFLLNKVYS
jgi:hypothetical protein